MEALEFVRGGRGGGDVVHSSASRGGSSGAPGACIACGEIALELERRLLLPSV